MIAAFTAKQQRQLLASARAAIEYGLEHHQVLDVVLRDYDERLQQPDCSFVSLYIGSELRGCIGSLSVSQPLINDVVQHAFGAAFSDCRFASIRRNEMVSLSIEISVLTPQCRLSFNNEKDLIAQLVPFKDGLTLEDGPYHATFLPAVWHQFADKELFLTQLKLKAAMPKGYWSKALKAFKYQAIVIKLD